MRKTLKALSNKQGFSYILTCVMVLISVMLIAIAMQYAYVYHVAREQKNEVQLQLDSYVTRYAVEKYDALKQGSAYDRYIDRAGLAEGTYAVLGFSRSATEKSEETYVMYRPWIESLTDDAVGVQVEYEIIIPFELFNRKIADISVPVTIISQFKQK